MSNAYRPFVNDHDSHQHSLETLNTLYEFDDFMSSIRTLVDMGCGTGLDLEWWATRTTRDSAAKPLNIRCVGVDLAPNLSMASKHKNITYQPQDFCDPILIGKHKFDVIWCHDSFQYVIDPFSTLRHWWNAVTPGAMLVLMLPQSTVMEGSLQAFDQWSKCYCNWTMVNLIHVLAVSGWDCAGGFFKKDPGDPWLHAVVYRSNHEPMDPRSVTWYDLCDRGLLPKSAVDCIQKYGYLRQRDLVLPWIDRSLRWMAQE